MRQAPRFSFGTGLAPQTRIAAVPNGARAPPLRTIFRIDARISHSPYRAPANANRRRFDHTLTHGSRRPYPQAARISAVSGSAYVFAFMAISRVVHHATALNEQTAAIRRSNRQYIAAILPCQAIPRTDHGLLAVRTCNRLCKQRPHFRFHGNSHTAALNKQTRRAIQSAQNRPPTRSRTLARIAIFARRLTASTAANPRRVSPPTDTPRRARCGCALRPPYRAGG